LRPVLLLQESTISCRSRKGIPRRVRPS
jgi:hypothetical protein